MWFKRRRCVLRSPMHGSIRVALIGDRNDAVTAHQAIPVSLALAGEAIHQSITPVWIHTSELDSAEAVRALRAFDGIWCVPASPYANTEGALLAIQLARSERIPFLGTCGGFQHAIIEYFRNRLGIVDPGHEELDPASANPVISRLSCSLVEVTATIRLKPGSWMRQLYGTEEVPETFHCNYGANAEAAKRISSDGDLIVEGTDEAGNIRIVRLKSHPFFIGTLFQPERAGLRGVVHPLVRAFAAATARIDDENSRELPLIRETRAG